MLFDLIPGIFKVELVNMLIQVWVLFDFLQPVSERPQTEILTEVSLVRLSLLIREAVAVLDKSKKRILTYKIDCTWNNSAIVP